VEFSDSDDSFVGPIDIGFDFKFYENSYPQVYISTNGLISFGMGSASYENRPIPLNLLPHNYIAPFWDDLIMETYSQVFYRLVEDGSFVVEWYQVPRIGTQDKLTFEVILKPNGDIIFQYNELNGDIENATVGIEDEHSVDGLQYLYNAPGVRVDRKVEINRPAPAPRAKVFPLYDSDFTIQRKAILDFTVRNSGDDDNDQDTYDLSWTSDLHASDWSWSFTDVDGNPLVDSDTDGVVDTGPINQGEDFKVRAEIQAPPDDQAGDTLQLNIQATSTNDPNRSASTLLQAAVPAPFAQALSDKELGVGRVRLIWKETQIDSRALELESSIPGDDWDRSEPGVISMENGFFLNTWENSGNGGIPIKIEYMYCYPFGEVYQSVTDLTNHDLAETITLDEYANFGSTSSGYIGGIWVRSLLQLGENENVYLSILDPNGQISLDQSNLTNNEDWGNQQDEDLPFYKTPKISATDDDNFILAWVDDRLKSGGSVSDVVYAVYDQSGNQVSAPQAVTQSEPGGDQYSTPTLVPLVNGKTLLAYTIGVGGVSSSLGYVIINSDGTIAQGETIIPGVPGSSPDGIKLSTGDVLLAWQDPIGGTVGYATIDGSTYALKSGPHVIDPPDKRTPTEVSVTADKAGNGIITWGDAVQDDHLYYTLVGSDGLLVTPAMIFLTGSGSDPEVKTNSSGLGNASYQGIWQMFMPLLRR
jgi:hypothetical protein